MFRAGFLLLICTFVPFAVTGCGAGRAAAGVASVVVVDEGLQGAPAVSPAKRGSACVVNVLNLVSVGDASIKEAMTDGGITKVATIDREIFGLNVFYLPFSESCTVVRGE